MLYWLSLLLIRVVKNESGQSWEYTLHKLEDMSLVELCGKDVRAQMATRPLRAPTESGQHFERTRTVFRANADILAMSS